MTFRINHRKCQKACYGIVSGRQGFGNPRTLAHRWYKKQSRGIKILALLSDWSIRDSNPWPPQCECGALPAALIPHNGNNGARTHDLPLVRRALSQLSYVSIFFWRSVFLSSLQHGMPVAASSTGGNQLEEPRMILKFKSSYHARPTFVLSHVARKKTRGNLRNLFYRFHHITMIKLNKIQYSYGLFLT